MYVFSLQGLRLGGLRRASQPIRRDLQHRAQVCGGQIGLALLFLCIMNKHISHLFVPELLHTKVQEILYDTTGPEHNSQKDDIP